ncbi:MAG: cis-3-hydroxy-L-proline dehydratase [Acidimicrobiales bacterium]|jgi:L-alanine-DL-glutamate epimerase-like enolase superfamily enzyme
MKISRIRAYQVALPMGEGAYAWGTQSFAAFDSTVLVIDTDEGLSGVGEICPLGPSYLPAYAEGARTGIELLARDLIGEDPLAIDVLNHKMDALMKGHPYVKSAIDMACWDLLGKATGLPVCELLGGRFTDQVRLFRVISRDTPDNMVAKLKDHRADGFMQFQMKVGEHPDVDIERMRAVCGELRDDEVLAADANTGWKQHEAIRVMQSTADLPLYVEQPCLSYEECLVVRQHTMQPMILDECMDSLRTLLRGVADGAMDLINLKISRAGGLTRARQIRDLCVSLGIVMTIEDTWGGEIATAAIAHLAGSTPTGFHFQSSPFHTYATISIADGGPVVKDGHMSVSTAPGLGVEPIFDVLGEPIFDVR